MRDVHANNSYVVYTELVESSQSGRCGGEKVKPMGQCKVCGDSASGTYFGALVCVPCKVTIPLPPLFLSLFCLLTWQQTFLTFLYE